MAYERIIVTIATKCQTNVNKQKNKGYVNVYNIKQTIEKKQVDRRYMMNDFDRNNKAAGIYWLKQPIKDLKIKIIIKPKSSITILPKYEDYLDTTDTVDLENIETKKTEEYIFNWQEKVFSAWEIDNYKDVHNCISESDLTYHNMLNAKEFEAKKVFTYIHEDYFLPLPTLTAENNAFDKHILKCNVLFKSLGLDERFGGMLKDSNSMHHLFQSNENIALEDQQWISMHIVFDDSLYAEDSQLLLKQEYTLVSLYYNTIHNYLMITPDTNDFATNPYALETQTNSSKYQYGVEIIFPELGSDEELVSLLNKLYVKWEKRHNDLLNFTSPPIGRTKIYVAFELSKAEGFEGDDLYIEFEIRVPEDVVCESQLRGRTHVAKALMMEGVPHWSFGQIIELELEVEDGGDSSRLQIFFEAITMDWWGRHRTEGYFYLPLALSPGHFTEQLSCSRPDEINKMEAENRRFFVGGCHLIEDLEILTKPQLQKTKFMFTETGTIDVRWSTVRHTQPAGVHSRSVLGGSSSSALLQGAEAVLRQYSQARAKLAAATKDLADPDE